ncbi:hypothetical protein Tco_0813406 [Tanacetum coccineum]
MDRLPGDAIGIYTEFLWFSGVRIPFLTFLLSVLKYFKDVCMDDGPSSLKKWKDKYFLIDRRAILDYLTWRHSCSCVSDDLPTDGYDRNDVEQLCAHLIRIRGMREEVLIHSEMGINEFMTLPSWSDAKIVKESHNLSSSLLDRVSSHNTTPVTEGAMILLPTADEITTSIMNPRLAKKSKGLSQARVHSSSDNAPEPSQQLRRRKLRKRASEPGSSATELCQTKAASAPVPHLGKRLGAPSSVADVSASGPSPVRISVHAFTSRHNLSLGGAIACGHVGKSRAEVMWCQLDPLDSLDRSALAHDVKYDQILDDDFGTATLGEEIDLTLFPLAPDVCRKALDQTITPAELRRTESLLPLELSNHVNVLSVLLVSHGYELNSRYTNLVSSKALLQEKLDQKKGDVRLLRSEVTYLYDKLKKLQRDYDALGQENRELCSQRDAAFEEVKKLQSKLTNAKAAFVGLMEELTQTNAKLSEQALTVRDLHNELSLERSKSQGYKNSADELRAEIAHFIGSGVEGLVRKFLSSDEFYAALAHVASPGINYGVERGLHMGRIDADFEMAVQKVYNFQVGAKVDFDKALVGFPTTPFPFLDKVVAAARGTLSDVAHILMDIW